MDFVKARLLQHEDLRVWSLTDLVGCYCMDIYCKWSHCGISHFEIVTQC